MLDKKVVQRDSYLAWNILAERNRFVFENITQPLVVVSQRVGRQVEEHNEYTTRIYGRLGRAAPVSATRWCVPPQNVVKINADAHLSSDGWVGMGVVARNSTGKVVFAGVRKQRACWPPDVAECKAILFAVHLARSHGVLDVIIESDAKVVIFRLSKAALFFFDLDSILGDVISLSMCFNSISFSHVKRDGNAVAHNLARVVLFGVEQCWENHCPREVSPYVLMDILSLD